MKETLSPCCQQNPTGAAAGAAAGQAAGRRQASRWTRWPRPRLHALTGEAGRPAAAPPCPGTRPSTAPHSPTRPTWRRAAAALLFRVPRGAGRPGRAVMVQCARASRPPCRPIMTSVTLQGTVSPRAPPPTRPHTPALPPAAPPAPVRRSKGWLWPCSCKYFKVHHTLLTS